MMHVFPRSHRAGGVSYIRSALRLRGPLAIMTMAFAALGLLTNYANVDVLLQPLNGRSATHPITALCLFFIGFGALRLRRFGRTSMWRFGIGAAIIIVCATRLMEAALTQSTGAAGLAVFGPIGGFQGRFSIEAAMALGAFAVADVLRQGWGRWGMIFLAMGLATVFNTLLEISYGLTFFNGDVGAFTCMAMVCSGGAMITVYIHRPTIRVAFLVGDIGTLTRSVGAAAIVLPWFWGLLLHWIGGVNVAAMPMEAAMISAITWSMLAILVTTAARHEGSVAARRRVEREIVMQSRIDPLTGALNQFGMMEVVEGAWVDFKSVGRKYGMVLIDLEYFRQLDQTFGSGDSKGVLPRVAATVQGQLRGGDALGRWGADEFMVLLKIKDVSDIAIVASRLRRALVDAKAPFCAGLDMQPASMLVPLGTSDMRDNDEAPNDAIIRADCSLYISKAERDAIELGQSASDLGYGTQAEMEAEFAQDEANERRGAAA